MSRMFGTDGVRGVAGTELSIDLATKLGQAGAYVLTEGREIRNRQSLLDVIPVSPVECLPMP